jgi:hypothetical protein
MFGRHFLAAAIMAIGVVVGIIIGVDDWKKGLVVGAIIVGAAFLFACANMYFGIRKEFKKF